MILFEEGYKKFEAFVLKHGIVREDDKEIMIGYSGGKDASLMCDFFYEYKKRKAPGLSLKMLVARFPSFLYDTTDPDRADIINGAFDYWKERGFDIVFLDHQLDDPKSFLESSNPCKTCAKIKTELMGKYIRQYSSNEKVYALGMNLDDCLSWMLEVILLTGNYRNIDTIKNENPELYRYIKTLFIRTRHLLYDRKSKTRFIRPIISFTNEEITELVNQRDLPIIPEECAAISKRKTFRDSPRREFSVALKAMRLKYATESSDKSEFINDYDKTYDFVMNCNLFPNATELDEFMAESLMV